MTDGGSGRGSVGGGGVVYIEVTESNPGAETLQDLSVIEVSFTRRYRLPQNKKSAKINFWRTGHADQVLR